MQQMPFGKNESDIDWSTPGQPAWPPRATRAQGLQQLDAFICKAGRAYQTHRNTDLGSGRHGHVSLLSPYLRHRLIDENEVISQVLNQHTQSEAFKFIQEVFWRTYWKGWLEQRRLLWPEYQQQLPAVLQQQLQNRRQSAVYTAAISAATQVPLFNEWCEELINTGYLHNHARMWFASIWIFTLELPWRLGADFFFRHLLDGDPASNTLGWRWVAGLHTRGKHYQAQAWNIAKFTNNRFKPRPEDLSEIVEGLENEEPEGLPVALPIRTPKVPDLSRPSVLLITEEDCRPEDFDLSSLNLIGCATLSASHLRSPLTVAPIVDKFEQSALGDAASRINLDITELRAGTPNGLVRWASRTGASQIVTPFIPTGPLRDWIIEATPSLNEAEIEFVELRRNWDDAIWRYATAGFFKVKKQIPDILKIKGIL